jgi:histidine ammonia-lyase
MGATAGRQALQILGNVKNVLVIAVLTAHHAAEIRRRQFAQLGLKTEMGKATAELFEEVKNAVPDFREKDFLNNDRFLFDDIKRLSDNYENFADVAGRNLE